jgi:hypothetical protein
MLYKSFWKTKNRGPAEVGALLSIVTGVHLFHLALKPPGRLSKRASESTILLIPLGGSHFSPASSLVLERWVLEAFAASSTAFLASFFAACT